MLELDNKHSPNKLALQYLNIVSLDFDVCSQWKSSLP